MDVDSLRIAVRSGRFLWRKHALQRMAEQDIRQASVLNALLEGEIIEEYETDRPFPSGLFLGAPGGRPIHVVASYDHGAKLAYVITAYEPDAEHFETDFRTRKKQ